MKAAGADAAPGEWDKIRIMGKQIAPDDALFVAGAAAPAAVAAADLDMELHADSGTIDLDIGAQTTAFSPDLELTAENLQVSEDTGIDFILDEPLRGADESVSVATTIEAKRVKAASSADEPTAEMSIEDLGIEVGDLQGLDDELFAPSAKAVVEDTVESLNLRQPAAEPEEDLLSSTSILRREVTATMPVAKLDEPTGQMDALDMTGELPTLETATLAASSDGDTVDQAFSMDEEATTMSEVGTKLDLARAYIDMGDPEGARSILDEVLSEGSAVQKQEAERLIASLP
jgi:pilus assembly protein FimV